MKSGSGISGVNWQERPHYRILHPTGFAQKVGQSDPLPPAAAVPLCKGDNKPSNTNECILPLEKGESRVAAGGRSARLFVQSPFAAYPRLISLHRAAVRFKTSAIRVLHYSGGVQCSGIVSMQASSSR